MSDSPQCPYCDKPRGYNRHGIMVTCGADKCFRAACRAAQLGRSPPSGDAEIDFANGFAAHNLRFQPALYKVPR